MTTSAERKFINLRKRLDQLGYRQPLAIESLPLVEKLFSDLVHTTESLRNAKLAAGKTEKESRNVDAVLEPYKAENARLIRENNELHLGLLKLREEKDRIKLKAYIRKLDHETSDLKFLNNQYVHKVRSLEQDSQAKAERILQLQEKNMQAVVQTPGGKKRSIPFRRQRMQIDELLPPSSGPIPSSVAQPDDPYIADLLQVADDRIQELQKEVAQLKLDLERAQAGIKHLNTQVEERDKEIERLNRALDGGRPNDVISLEAQNISNEKLIAHLNLQIEYLQETNRSLEQRIDGLQQRKKTVSSEVADLSTRNQELCQELTEIDQLAQQLEKDKEMVLETADMELHEAKVNSVGSMLVINLFSFWRFDMAEGDHVKDRLRDQLLDLQEQNDKMEGLIHFLEVDKKRLQDKVEAMTQEMILELERMHARHGMCGKEQSPSRLDGFVKSLEEERNYYKQELERYRLCRGRTDKSPTPSPDGDAELSRALKERDELQSVLLGFEKHMEDIQTRVKLLTAERDRLSTQYQQVRRNLEINFFLSSCTQNSKSALYFTFVCVCVCVCVCAFRLLQDQMEHSLSDVQHRLSVKTNELQAAHQQIDKLEEKIAYLSRHGSSQKDEVAALQGTVASLDREKDVLQDAVDQKTESMVLLQEEIHRKEKTLLEVRLTVTDLENALDQLKVALSSREREISSLRRQLDQSQEELSAVSRDREVALRENRRLQDDLATMTRENQAVHAEMQEALNERDELKLRVHSYISEVARIESMMAAKEQENKDMLEHFRTIHTESEDRELKLQQAEGLNNSIRLELLSSDTERRHLRERVSLQDREIQEHLNALQAYEAQVSSLARAMSHLEEEVQATRAEKASVLADLASVRELCVKLDSSKELTVRQLRAKSMEMERMTGEMEDVHSEVELLKKQLASERVTVHNLETLLSTNRQKEFQTHLSASEKESDLQVLKDRLALADSKTAGHAREVSQLRGKLSQLQTEMDVLKRQLTTERFERERAVQEMRRQGLSFSSLRSSSPLSTSLSPRPASPEHSILHTQESCMSNIIYLQQRSVLV
uniref:Centrosomal protein 135 n=1 Tax=Cyprinus carpio TaxID=7962 RepID=A0A8C2HAI2_CYPCA